MNSTSRDNPYTKQRKSTPKALQSIEVSRSADGGFVMKHSFSGYQHEPESHPAKTGAAMIAHLSKHMGIKGEGAGAA